MKLSLSNFRCFKDFTFEIPEDNGVLLLWGTSGIGKTTIFKAINFVLYGKEQKVTKHGEKKCKVIFEFKDIIITRTKCPNHLTFKRTHDPFKNTSLELSDDSAQKEIEKIFGKDFLLTSYMAQKSTESFFSLSSNDKSAFLHRLSIKDFDVDSIRKKTRELIKQRKEKLLINTTEQKVIKNMYDSLNCSSAKEPKIKIDLKGKSIDEFIENENKLKDKVKKLLKEKREELSTLSSILEKVKINTVRIEEKNKQLNDIIFKLQDYSYLENGIALDNLKTTLEEYNKISLYYTLKKSCKDLKNEYDKMVEEERKKIEEDISKLKVKKSSINILKDNDLEDITKAKTIYEKIKMKTVSDIKSKLLTLNTSDSEKELETLHLKEMRENLSLLQLELENIKKNIKDIADITSGITTKHKCPKCETKIYIDKDCIKEIPENIDELKINLENLKKKKEKLELNISSLSKEIKTTNDKIVSLTIEISNNIKLSEELTNYLKVLENIPHTSLNTIKSMIEKDTENRYVLKTIEESLSSLEEKSKMSLDVLPHYIKKKRDELLGTKKKYEEIKEQLEEVEINENLNWYIDEIQNINSKISRYEQSIKERNKLIKDKDTLETEIHNLQVVIDTNKNIKNIEELQDEINKKMETEDKLKQREIKLIKYKEDLSVYKKQLEIMIQLDNLKQDENILLRALKTSEILFKKINDAESISLENTLDIINTDLEEFVTHFFGEHFSAKLQSFKESKDGDKKASIEIIIVQDGETVPLDALSGGEYDRLALALFLCFNKISKSNIILLDECLASLHSELVEDIVELIKNKLNDKLVMFTLHQANTGIFDTIIDIEKEISGI
jgi:DNA repair exonuclease SbcCD ATPase subunit